MTNSTLYEIQQFFPLKQTYFKLQLPILMNIEWGFGWLYQFNVSCINELIPIH